MNYFELFGLPLKFELDKSALKAKYYEHMQSLYAAKDSLNLLSKETSKLESAQSTVDKAAELNAAYRELNDDCLRAKYLLRLIQKQSIQPISKLTGEQFKQLTSWQAILLRQRGPNIFDNKTDEKAYRALCMAIEESKLNIQHAFESKNYSQVHQLLPGFEALHALRDKYLAYRPNSA